MDCLFCKIINGEIPSKKIYEDEYSYAFYDIQPQAKIHALVIPKKHIASFDEQDKLTDIEKAALFTSITKVAALLNISGNYRVVSNCGEHACQSVHHLHFHILGGEQLSPNMA